MTWDVDRDTKNFILTTVLESHPESVNSKTPAVQEYDKLGRLLAREFLTDAKLHNPDPSVAAYETYYPNGGLRERRFCIQHNLNNAEDGTPAKTTYYENGVIQEFWCMENGEKKDSAYGEPAIAYYDCNGKVTCGYSSNTDEILTSAETEIRLGIGRIRRIVKICEGAGLVIAGRSAVSIDAGENKYATPTVS